LDHNRNAIQWRNYTTQWNQDADDDATNLEVIPLFLGWNALNPTDDNVIRPPPVLPPNLNSFAEENLFKPVKMLAQMLRSQRLTFELSHLIRKETAELARLYNASNTPSAQLARSLELDVMSYLIHHGRKPNESETWLLAKNHRIHIDAVKRFCDKIKDPKALGEEAHQIIDECLAHEPYFTLHAFDSLRARTNLCRHQLMAELSKRVYPTIEEKKLMDEHLHSNLYLPPTLEEEPTLIQQWNISPIKLRYYFFNYFQQSVVPLPLNVVQKATQWSEQMNNRLPTLQEVEHLSNKWDVPVNRLSITLLQVRRGHCGVDEQQVERLLRHNYSTNTKVKSYRYSIIGLKTGIGMVEMSEIAKRVQNSDKTETATSARKRSLRQHCLEWMDKLDHIPNKEEIQSFCEKHQSTDYRAVSLLVRKKLLSRAVPEEKKSIIKEYIRLHGQVPNSTWPQSLTTKVIGIAKLHTRQLLMDFRLEFSKQIVGEIQKWRESQGDKNATPSEIQMQEWIDAYPGFREEIQQLVHTRYVPMTLLPFSEKEKVSMKDLVLKWNGKVPPIEIQNLSNEMHRTVQSIESWIRSHYKHFYSCKVPLNEEWEEELRDWLHKLGRFPLREEKKQKAQEMGTNVKAITRFMREGFDKSVWRQKKVSPELREKAQRVLEEHKFEIPPQETKIALADEHEVSPRSIHMLWLNGIRNHKRG